MSAAVSEETAETASVPERDDQRPARRRRARWFAALALVLAVAAVMLAVTDPFGSHATPQRGVVDNGNPTSLATVTRGSLVSQTEVSGTLGYAGSYSVVNEAAGASTWLPSAGQVVRRGEALYRAAGEPVVLLYGATPAYRLLKEGLTGTDVEQLNANLVALWNSPDFRTPERLR